MVASYAPPVQPDDRVARPSTTTYAREVIRTALLRVETCYPAIVDAYYAPAAGRPAQVDVRLCRRYRREIDSEEDLREGCDLETVDDSAGNPRHYEVGDYPPIPRVPVAWPGLGGMHLTGKIDPGEVGLVLNTGRSIDLWQTRGGVVDPIASSQFALSNAVFLPGLRSGADPAEVPAAGWRLGADDGSWGIEVAEADGAVSVVPGSGKVKLGASSATAAVALATLVQARLDALATILSAWVVVPQDGGAALKSALAPWYGASNDVAATKVLAV